MQTGGQTHTYTLRVDTTDGPMVRSDAIGPEQMLPHGGIGYTVLIPVPISQILIHFFLLYCRRVWDEIQGLYEKS